MIANDTELRVTQERIAFFSRLLANMRAQAEILYDATGCYSANAACTAASTTPTACNGGAAGNVWRNAQVLEALNAAGKASTGGAASVGTCTQELNNGAWSISMPLKSVPTQSWCIDSSGSSKERTGAPAHVTC